VIGIFPGEINAPESPPLIRAFVRESIGRATPDALMRVACPMRGNVRIFNRFCVQHLHSK
jgi:hypothetical protein